MSSGVKLGKLHQLAVEADMTLRDFLLEQLRKNDDDLAATAHRLGVSPVRVRVAMSRSGVIELRGYSVISGGSSYRVKTRYAPVEAIPSEFAPVRTDE